MSSSDPIDLLFGGMEKLGPGDDVETIRVWRMLPAMPRQVVVDAGCGTGRQTLVLAQEAGAVIQAVDAHRPFLETLQRRAERAGLADRIAVHCLDMRDIPQQFPRIDLLWSEGAAYSIGFAHALTTWATAIVPGGCAVVSELCWLRDEAPGEVQEFFRTGYPEMTTLAQNARVAEEAGYTVLATHVLPPEAWVQGYYDVLEPRAQALREHPEAAVREFAHETLREIEIFRKSNVSYGYAFLVLRRR